MILMVSFAVYFMIAKLEHGYQSLHGGCMNGEVNRIAAQRWHTTIGCQVAFFLALLLATA